MSSEGQTPPANRASKANIVSVLRGEVVAGELPLGSRLPNRRELGRRFSASSVTVQRAMDRLMQDGFVYADGPNGTFVSPYPPHLYRYGLLFPSQPADPNQWRRFAATLCDEARHLDPETHRTIAIYYNINAHADSDDYRRLLRDLRTQRLAGLIIVDNPSRLIGTPILEEDAPPRVAIMEEPGLPKSPALGHDAHSFIDKALDHLQQQGRRNIAILTGEHPAGLGFHDYLMSALAARDMVLRPYWLQGVFVGHPELAHNLMWLMMNPQQDQRPDGLIIYDDNLVEDAVAGLIDSGVRVPQDLDIVVHANFPWTIPTAIPVARIGYHAGRTLDACLDLIERQRRGESVPRLSQMPAIEEEHASAHIAPAELQTVGAV